jgi:hypothetical protein
MRVCCLCDDVFFVLLDFSIQASEFEGIKLFTSTSAAVQDCSLETRLSNACPFELHHVKLTPGRPGVESFSKNQYMLPVMTVHHVEL